MASSWKPTPTASTSATNGSDFCFTPALSIERQIAAINAAPVPVQDATWQSLTTGNALHLLPRLNPPPAASSTGASNP